ncbi:uncharacterized protein V6R79_007182 [Siganus canaliculatus]
MEPLDPAKNDETSGFSKRRISSILKAPRKSILFPDPEQLQNVKVECPKPVEKRNSRRVSFAPANDVLLFSDNLKNASPARSPLQDLITTTTATQNRIQMAEDGIQQITGMETLLNAPLFPPQQKEKVGFDTGDNHGEKTMIFSTDDAFMDMTHSHTINIAHDAELGGADISFRKLDALSSGEKTVMLAAEDGSMDMTLNHSMNTSGSVSRPSNRSLDLSAEARIISSSVPCLDPGFESFLSNVFKPSGPGANPVNSRLTSHVGTPSVEETTGFLAQIKTKPTDVDKENLAPKSSSMMEKLLKTPRRTGETSYDSSQSVSSVQGLYSHFDSRGSQMEEQTKQQQSSRTTEAFNPKDKGSQQSHFPHASHRQFKFGHGSNDDCGEKTVMFGASDEFMDMTQSHTVHIESLALSNQTYTCEKMDHTSSLEKSKRVTCGSGNLSAADLDQGFQNFLSSLTKTVTPSGPAGIASVVLPPSLSSMDTLNKTSQLKTNVAKEFKTTKSFGEPFIGGTTYPGSDVSMEMTEAKTGHTVGMDGQGDAFQFLFAKHGMKSHCERQKKTEVTSTQKNNAVPGSSNSTGLETFIAPSLNGKQQTHQAKFDVEGDFRERTVRFSVDDGCMDETQSHTVNIITGFDSQPPQKDNTLHTNGEKTVRFTVDDEAMDMTRSHTVNIVRDLGLHPQQNVDFLPGCAEKTVRFSADDGCMDVTKSHTVNIVTGFDFQPNKKVDTSPTNGEKTMRFTVNDGAMDMTRSHTVNIVRDLDLHPQQNVDFIPGCAEKTVRFSADDGCMDVTRSHTVNIVSDLDPQSSNSMDFVPVSGEKTVRFTAKDAAMDVTRSHTVNIVSGLEVGSDVLPACGDKTVRFAANDAGMDITQSHTVNIVRDLEPQSGHIVDSVLACGEKTKRFTADDAAMDVTQSHTVNIIRNTELDSVRTKQDSSLSVYENMFLPSAVKKRQSETSHLHRNRQSSVQALDPGFKDSLSRVSGPGAHEVSTNVLAPAALSSQKTVDTNGFEDEIKIQKADADIEKEAPGVEEYPVNQTVTDCPEVGVTMQMTEALTGHTWGLCTNETPQRVSEDLDPEPDHLKKMLKTSQQISGSESQNFDECGTRTKPEARNQPCSPTTVDHDVDAVPSRKSRRMTLADLHSKVRRLSHMVNTAPDVITMDSCTAPLPQLIPNTKDKVKSLPVLEPELEKSLTNTEENTHSQGLMDGDQATTSLTAAPFNLETKQLMSRLSVGGFKAKLPQRSKQEPKKHSLGGEHTKTMTLNVTSQLTTLNMDVSDIYDEELGSCEDMSEMVDERSLRRTTENNVSPSQDFNTAEPLVDDVFVPDCVSPVHGLKRPSPVEESDVDMEKRLKASNETATERGFQSCHADWDSNFTAAPCSTTQRTDESYSTQTTSIRCEATFESTFKHSTLFESQLEDYSSDAQRKLDDGTITVLEFFKLFNMDFVIHNPRQSVLPAKPLSDTDRTLLDSLKDKHINRPKQMVYEKDVLSLREKVEGLKERKQDLDKPLKVVNRALWEDLRKSSEKELKSFGAKLKERNNFFRKTSKAQSHDMKEALYSSLVQTNLAEQQRLKGTIGEADEMIKSLDDCIHELETELAAVEQTDFEDAPSMKACQQEVKKVTEALAQNDRQKSELEIQMKQNSTKQKNLRAETKRLEGQLTALHMLNEWKLGENKDDCTVYTFLHGTLHLQLLFEKPSGNDADDPSKRKISHISFKHELDEEKSWGHASLIHKLLCQYTEGETSWVEKYPTSRHVPKLLQEVGLVVSRCRLLGEELRLLSMWGGLRLDILSISCVDTQVHIVFSSLKKMSKFEVVFSVSLTQHRPVLQLHKFTNLIGSATLQQIEEIVASFTPGKNVLTKTVKKIHHNLLC